MKPVTVLSKGRPNSSLLVNHSGFYVFVEPQEYELYSSRLPQHIIVDIEQNNMGIEYVRNYILSYMPKNGMSSFWQLDDDISAFYSREGTKLTKCSIQEAFEAAEKSFESTGTNLGGLSYRHLAWSAKRELESNCSCLVCIYVSNVYPDILFRGFGGYHSDNDFSMQCIRRGLVVNRNTMFAFSCPVPGTNSGGMKQYYTKTASRRENAADLFVATWGSHIVSKRYNYNSELIGLFIRWKKINSKQQQQSIKF
jgi:hypothetical protein